MDQEEQCTKKSFKDLKSAHSAINKIRGGREKREFTPVRAYRCEICGNYHLTHHERMHWLINTDFRISGQPASPEIIKDRIEELTRIIELKKEEYAKSGNMENNIMGNKKKGFKSKSDRVRNK